MKLTKTFASIIIPKRRSDAHKGDFGHVLIIAGSRGMSGAAVLCANAAIRSGAGLVTLAVPEGQSGNVLARIFPEVMMVPFRETPSGTFTSSVFNKLTSYIYKRKITSIAVGPGLAVNAETGKLVSRILTDLALPVVLDADGINVLAGSGILKKSRAQVILTPHPGELSRLLGLPVKEIQGNREKTAQQCAHNNKIICVLKGKSTVVTDGKTVYINTTGNPGMATGGSGDVLAGMTAALTAQVKGAHGKRMLNAAAAGVYLHGLAGDIAAKKKTQASMIAGDIIDNIPAAFRKLKR